MPPCLKDALDVSCGWRLLRTKLTYRKESVESAGLGLRVWGLGFTTCFGELGWDHPCNRGCLARALGGPNP